MKKYEFTQEGFNELQDDLYQLPDTELNGIAAALLENFKAWVADYFILAESQLEDLQGIAWQASALFAFNGSYAIRNRRPLYLEKVELKSTGDTGKMIRPTSNLSAISDREGNFIAGGSFTVEIIH